MNLDTQDAQAKAQEEAIRFIAQAGALTKITGLTRELMVKIFEAGYMQGSIDATNASTAYIQKTFKL